MMKKCYAPPNVIVRLLETNDIVTASTVEDMEWEPWTDENGF